MGKSKYKIKLNDTQQTELKALLSKGESKARTQTRCRILLLADAGETDKSIAQSLQISPATVYNIKKRYLKSGLQAALTELPRPGAVSKFSGKQRARITAIACSTPPDGRSRWTLRLLADKVVELEMTDSISHVGIYKLLKKTICNRI